ncbi:hypothetical protein BH23ACI1_BH23ACI1_08310 [soil metagenome]
MEFSTRTIHAEQPSEPGTGAVAAPIFQTSTFEQEAPASTAGLTTHARTTRRAHGSKRSWTARW